MRIPLKLQLMNVSLSNISCNRGVFDEVGEGYIGVRIVKIS